MNKIRNRYLERRINILAIFLHNSLWGSRIRGDERRFLELAKRFATLGAKLSVIEFAPSLQKFYYKANVYTSIELESKGLIGVIIQLIRLTNKFKNFDIIYVYNQDFLNLLAGIIFKLFTRKPLVMVVQSLQDIELPLKTLRQMYGASLIDLIFILSHKYFLMPLALRLANIVFTVSNTLKRNLIERYPSVRGKIVATFNGVDTNKFHPMNLEKEYDVIFLGRIHITHKGIDKILLIWKNIVNRYPQAKLIIVGGFESERDREILYKLIEKLDIRNNVIVTGFIDDDKVAFYLNKAKAFISLSTYEGFGLSILEALACGLPVITTDLEVFHELHGNLLFYVSTKNAKDLVIAAKKLLMLLHDGLINESLNTTLQEHIKNFSWDLVAYREFAFIKKQLNF
ncbi:MAG: glycosyltransferase family 4 protein [Thermoproteota archaeon]